MLAFDSPRAGGEGERVVAVILSSRETPEVLMAAVRAVAAEPALRGGVLDVVVNGNRSLADRCAEMLGADVAGALVRELRLWFLPLGDKAHAWNTYVHELWPGGVCTVFIDGYVRVMPGALAALRCGLDGAEEVLAATGVPTVGRSAASQRRDMLRGGGIHGNLYALSESAMGLARDSGFRLPLGLYRTDALLGAALFFRFAPDEQCWAPERVRVLPAVTWRFDPLHWWRLSDLLTHGRRLLRQRQGTLENRAYRHLLGELRLRPGALGETAAQMVERWLLARPDHAAQVRKAPLLSYALKRLRRERDWSSVTEPAKLLRHVPGGHAASENLDADERASALDP